MPLGGPCRGIEPEGLGAEAALGEWLHHQVERDRSTPCDDDVRPMFGEGMADRPADGAAPAVHDRDPVMQRHFQTSAQPGRPADVSHHPPGGVQKRPQAEPSAAPIGAGDGGRTRDLLLGKETLYH